jgi:hypothetical protein
MLLNRLHIANRKEARLSRPSITIRIAPTFRKEDHVTRTIRMLPAFKRLQFPWAKRLNSRPAAPPLFGNKRALIGDNISHIRRFLAQPYWGSKHADSNCYERKSKKRKQLKRPWSRGIRSHPTCPHDPKNREPSPENPEHNEEPTKPRKPFRNRLACPNDAFARAKFHLDAIADLVRKSCEVGVIHVSLFRNMTFENETSQWFSSEK